MAYGFAVAVLVEVGLDVMRGDGEILMEKAEEIGCASGLGGCGFVGVVLEGEEFDAVAGGEDETFSDAGLVQEGSGRVSQAAGGDGETFANLDRCGVVIDPEQDQTSVCRRVPGFVHGAVNL
jgi:hypothetical protein